MKENRRIKHRHLLVRAKVNNPPMDADFISRWMKELIQEIGMTLMLGPIAGYCNAPSNRGITCVAILTTSHAAVHVWDETRPALLQLDVYSCSDLDLDVVFKKLTQFDPVKVSYKFFDREHGFKEIASNS